ncbi:MAG: pantothenate synthetase [Phycisphaerae bacterium]|nr:MAG: pantothenate synthetase [Phycisphaerae bacterium]
MAGYAPVVEVCSTMSAYDRWRLGVERCVVVPTMGALHRGHASLMEAARRARPEWPIVVTVFVNPTQFSEAADFERYPKTLDADAALCRDAGAACVLAPSAAEVYPRGPLAGVPPLPAVATRPGLEDRFRPGHFAGVCQVVRRLFEMTRPHAAIFGEKDWQQLQVIRAMVRELDLGVEIVASPTVREADGLAMSSRNRFLTAEDRTHGLALSRALREASQERTVARAEERMAVVLSGLDVEYAVIRDAESLEAWREGRPGRALIAARVGSVRLIDNAAWHPRDA